MNKINLLMENLEKNNMQAFYAKTREEALAIVESLLKKGDRVTVGGSKSLADIGILNLLTKGSYIYLDRYDENLDSEEIYRQAFTCDSYITSTNALTMNGQLFNVDGHSNRVSAIAFGPKQVIVVAGTNKIVEDANEAILRVKEVAAPLNCKRLSKDTYCAKNGHCISIENKETKYLLGAGCQSNDRICCSYLLSGYQRHKDRIKLIIVGLSLGY